MEDIKVSICCITYNHENYIRDAIESFLMQKVDFPIEILIHDDASTDNTATIIKEYENKYPNIVKPIYQTINQYSQKIRVSKFNIERSKGKYIALCEGDDYWTDPFKLQKQINYLEKHSECSLVVHSAKVVNAVDNQIIGNVRPFEMNKKFSTEEVILGGGSLFPTNSMVFRNSDYQRLPDFYYNAPVGDHPLLIFLALVGEVYYIDETMSEYRSFVPGSWSEREFNTIEKKINIYEELAIMLDEINEYSQHRYYDVIQETKLKTKFYLLLEQGKISEAKSEIYKDYYNNLSLKSKMSMKLKRYSPSLHKKLYLLKGRILNAKSKH